MLSNHYKRLALQLAAQLPEDPDDARYVLSLVREMVDYIESTPAKKALPASRRRKLDFALMPEAVPEDEKVVPLGRQDKASRG